MNFFFYVYSFLFFMFVQIRLLCLHGPDSLLEFFHAQLKIWQLTQDRIDLLLRLCRIQPPCHRFFRQRMQKQMLDLFNFHNPLPFHSSAA